MAIQSVTLEDGTQVFYQDIGGKPGTPWVEVIDFPIPAGTAVTGSGVLLTSFPSAGSNEKYAWSHGPSISDPCKHTVVVSQAAGGRMDYTLRAWMSVIPSVSGGLPSGWEVKQVYGPAEG